jgi:hypothetical protein
MKPEINPEELKQLPGYECRAHAFMDEVKKIVDQVNKGPSSDLQASVVDPDERDRNLSESEIKRRKKLNQEIGIDDWISPEEREEMNVSIYSTCSFFEPMAEFIKKVFALAHRQGGRANGTTKTPSDKEIKNMISKTYINQPHYFIFDSTLWFTFDENLPGSI